MKTAGGRTDCDDTLDVKEDYRAVFYREYIAHQRAAFGSDVGLAEHFPLTHDMDDTAVAPVIVTLNM